MFDHPGPFSEAHGGPKMAQNITEMALHGPKCPFMTPNGPKHFPWVYYMILCHVGPPWGLFRGPLGPRWLLKRSQGGRIWHIIMNYPPAKCLRAILGHAWPFLVMKGHYGAVLGHFRAPMGLCKGTRVVQHDKILCNIPMASVLGPFRVM